jgi:hypothetical protein
MTSAIRFCSSCGKELPHDNVAYCPNCGVANTVSASVHQGPVQQSPVFVQAPYKSPGTAMLIALIAGIFGLLGIGHIYVGKLRRGILLLIGGLALMGLVAACMFSYNADMIYARYGYYSDNDNSAGGLLFLGIIFSLSYFALFVWQILDVRSSARKFNDLVKATGKEPW